MGKYPAGVVEALEKTPLPQAGGLRGFRAEENVGDYTLFSKWLYWWYSAGHTEIRYVKIL